MWFIGLDTGRIFIDERRRFMITLHPNILEQHGKKQFAVIPYEEFLKIQEELNDYEDFKELRQAKKAEKDAPTVSLEEVKKVLGL